MRRRLRLVLVIKNGPEHWFWAFSLSDGAGTNLSQHFTRLRNMAENLHEMLLHGSPPKKRRIQTKNNETGRFEQTDPLSMNFIAQYILFRTTFHDSRPGTQANSKNDYGWYPRMVKDWPLWLTSKRAESQEMPSRNILKKLWAVHQKQNKPQSQNFHTPPGPRKINILKYKKDSTFFLFWIYFPQPIWCVSMS